MRRLAELSVVLTLLLTACSPTAGTPTRDLALTAIPQTSTPPPVTRLAPATAGLTVPGPSPSPTVPAAPPTSVNVGVDARVVEVVDGDPIKVSLVGKVV